jgi:phenylalanyl-tRNA synthetase beta chain
MKILWSWLEELVDLAALTPAAVAERLAAAGIEVEELARVQVGAPGVLAATITAVRAHPAAERLRIATIDAGGPVAEVVCGAPNCEAGTLAVWAPPGARLPGGDEVGRAEIRGVASAGMLVSERELGMSDDHEGILLLDGRDAVQAGAAFGEVIPVEDWVLDLSIAANRPDLLSHLGVAREVAALTGARFQPPRPPTQLGQVDENVQLAIADADGCPRYTGYVLEDVLVRRAPARMRRRLALSGVRAISNVVDVTNYVLLELGHPQHAFDLDALDREAGGAGQGRINVRRASAGERLVTLDGVERHLAPEDLVIAGARVPLALAGVMGGQSCEVSPATRRVLLETATFDPVTVRRTSKRHALKSESSFRFERGVDGQGVPRAADRAAALLAGVAGARVRAARDLHVRPHERPAIQLRVARTNAVLGTELASPRVAWHLFTAGCRFEGPSAALVDPSRAAEAQRQPTVDIVTLTVRPPTWRPDLEREIDLIEEVARLEGYAAVPETAEHADLSARAPAEVRAPVEEVAAARAALAGLGFHEAVNYAFVSEAELATIRPDGTSPGPVVRLVNPLSAEQGVMRTSLLPGLLKNVRENLKHADGAWLFEVGRVFAPQTGPTARDPNGRPLPARERLCVAAVCAGPRDGGGLGAAPADFFDAKGALEALLDALRIRPVGLVSLSSPFLAGGAAGGIVSASGDPVALAGAVHPAVLDRWDIGQRAFALELYPLEARALLGAAASTLRPFPRFPGSSRDVALLLHDHVPAARALELFALAEEPLLVDARVFDEYRGANLPAGRKSLAYRLRYAAPDRTLTREEVDRAHAALVERVRSVLGAEVR